MNRTAYDPLAAESNAKVLPLLSGFFQIRKNGIEFQSSSLIPEWTEMTVDLQSSHSGGKLQCSGVVVACSGSKHAGYRVSMVFTSMTEQAQAQLNTMARSELGAG